MTNLEGRIKKKVGNLYGLRTWIEYGLKQIKDELGWADYRLTDYAQIVRWWEVVSSAYTLPQFAVPSPPGEAGESESQAGNWGSRGGGSGRTVSGAQVVGRRKGLEEFAQQLTVDHPAVYIFAC